MGEGASWSGILEVSGLTTEIRTPRGVVRALEEVSLSLAAGETLGIVGESGSGKSVLVRSLLLLLPEGGKIVEGELRYRGRDLLGMPRRELNRLRGTEIVHILPNAKSQLNPLVSVGDLMTAVIRVHESVTRREAHERAASALHAVGIPDPDRRLKAFPHELSGGMAQRVCIALALMHDPSLVIADEPTSGLDVTVQRQVLDLLTSATRERDSAQLIVTRDLGIVAHYCQRVAVMQAGRIVETARTLDLFESPTHPYTTTLLAAVQRRPRRATPEMRVLEHG